MTARKIIQLLPIAAGTTSQSTTSYGKKVHTTTGQINELFALCNDGTVWGISSSLKSDTWVQLPEIPQPQNQKETKDEQSRD